MSRGKFIIEHFLFGHSFGFEHNILGETLTFNNEDDANEYCSILNSRPSIARKADSEYKVVKINCNE